ncbi:MAG: helix-turn-helix domain-containing protein [Solirubrobacterales bacterium]|nr:helix-turn-helix domain-containing protein [Solirubrobacterales bacterium]
MPDEFLTVDDVAQLLKLNPQTVRNMIDRGELPAVRVGARRVRIQRFDLDAFLAEGGRRTQRTQSRVAFDDAMGAANKAIRGGDTGGSAVEALHSLSKTALALADELDARG